MILLFIIVILLIVGGFFSKNPGHTYNADFGNSFEHLSRFNHGFAVTGAKALTKEMSHTNCALFGPTGSGKSSVVIISSVASLAREKSSIIINDVTSEVWEHTSGYLADQGYRILRLDFSDSTITPNL